MFFVMIEDPFRNPCRQLCFTSEEKAKKAVGFFERQGFKPWIYAAEPDVFDPPDESLWRVKLTKSEMVFAFTSLPIHLSKISFNSKREIPETHEFNYEPGGLAMSVLVQVWAKDRESAIARAEAVRDGFDDSQWFAAETPAWRQAMADGREFASDADEFTERLTEEGVDLDAAYE